MYICSYLQDAQVTIECVIEQKHHRNILGAKGSNVQAITQEHNVSIKFPERGAPKASTTTGTTPAATGAGGEEEGEEAVLNGEEDKAKKARDVILITGRVENAEAAKQALLVSPGLGLGLGG